MKSRTVPRRRHAARLWRRARGMAGASPLRAVATPLTSRHARAAAAGLLELRVDLLVDVLQGSAEIRDVAGLPFRDDALEQLLVGGPGSRHRRRRGVRVPEDVQERLEV